MRSSMRCWEVASDNNQLSGDTEPQIDRAEVAPKMGR